MAEKKASKEPEARGHSAIAQSHFSPTQFECVSLQERAAGLSIGDRFQSLYAKYASEVFSGSSRLGRRISNRGLVFIFLRFYMLCPVPDYVK